jgi:hypothetical protein
MQLSDGVLEATSASWFTNPCNADAAKRMPASPVCPILAVSASQIFDRPLAPQYDYVAH